MIRRVGRPGLIGTMARTAVIAGTATAVAGGMQSRQQARAAAASQQQMQMAAPPAPPQPETQQAPQDDMLAGLAKLGQMKEAGLIDDAEFAAAKARLLGI